MGQVGVHNDGAGVHNDGAGSVNDGASESINDVRSEWGKRRGL
jgi:hypothetical protein